ncbi:MAG: hypothetical protein JWQ87_1924 [Candidatus Sulfotelmatobacter sp.]|nr:hypothetical protein [Candidatus Sulfotelmatobacter sp.]
MPRSKDPHNDGLPLGSAPGDFRFVFASVHVAGLAADEGFAYFHFTAKLAASEIILHRKAYTVEHEPCSLLSDA